MFSSIDEYFKIRLDIICFDGGKFDEVCSRQMAGFLSRENKWKPSEELYKEFCERYNEIYEDDLDYNIKLKIRDMQTLSLNEYYFQGTTDGVYLNQKIEIDYNRKDHHAEYYHYFFSFRLSKISPNHLEGFLKYHLHNAFNSDHKKYKRFLKLISGNQYELLDERFSFLKQWIKDELRETNSNRTLTTGTPPRQFNKNQIVLEYYYKIKAGTYPDITSEKTKKIKAITIERGIKSSKSFQTAFTNASKSGKEGNSYRHNILKNKSNQVAIAYLLNGDEKALLELKREIENLCNPIT